jgi:hypothetical protein
MMAELIEYVSGPTPEIFREKLVDQVFADLEKIARAAGLGELLAWDMESTGDNRFECTMTDIDGRSTKVSIEVRPIVLQ